MDIDMILPGTPVTIDIESGIHADENIFEQNLRQSSFATLKTSPARSLSGFPNTNGRAGALTLKDLPQFDVSSRSNSSLSSVSLTELQRSPGRSVPEIDRQCSRLNGRDSRDVMKSPARDISSVTEVTEEITRSNASLKSIKRTPSPFPHSVKNTPTIKSVPPKSPKNGAVVKKVGSEIYELADLPDVYSPHLVTGNDFPLSGIVPSPATYRVATKSVPKRPNTTSHPRTFLSVPKRKGKAIFVAQSIPNLRKPSLASSLMSDDDQISASIPSTTSSSSESRPSTGKSSALSRMATSIMSKLPTTPKLLRAWDDDRDSNAKESLSRSSNSSRPGTSASKRSSRSSDAESAVFLSDHDSLRDGQNCDMQWRAKLRLNCFLPPLSEKYLCPECSSVLHYPVQLSNCDHYVCSPCLATIMRGVQTCPVDGKPVDRSQVIVNRGFSDELKAKQLACPQSDLGCQWTGTYGNFKAHNESCEHAETLCPNGCGLRCERRLVDEHAVKECSLRMVVCEFCMRAIRAEKEIDHLKQCPRFPVSCSNSCGKKEIPREELTKHIEEHCPFGEVKCPFRRMGCVVAGTRDFIRRHITDDLTTHMEMLCLGLDRNSDQLQAQEETLKQQQTGLEDNENKTSNLLMRQGCQFLWKIDNWSQRNVEATAGRKTLLKSPPFYSGRYGYKLGLTLMPNGDGAAKGSNMSIYICVCKGEYDALQTWPFAMTVTFVLVDQCQDPLAKVDHNYVLRPNPCKENLPFLGRPSTNANPSFGAQYFAPLDILDTRDYIRDDVLFIKILTENN